MDVEVNVEVIFFGKVFCKFIVVIGMFKVIIWVVGFFFLSRLENDWLIFCELFMIIFIFGLIFVRGCCKVLVVDFIYFVL